MARSTHPYRKPPALADQGSEASSEELILYGMLVVIGAIPVVIALCQRATFGVDASLGLLMAGAGVLGAIDHAWRAWRNRSA